MKSKFFKNSKNLANSKKALVIKEKKEIVVNIASSRSNAWSSSEEHG